MSSSNCCFLTCIQVSQEADQVVWYSHLFQNFPQFIVIHIVKGFGIVNKAEVDVFSRNSLAFSMIQQILAIWSLVPLPFLNLAWTSGSSWFIYCWSVTWASTSNFEHYFSTVWDECNCAVVWAFFGIAFLWDWIENWPFPVLQSQRSLVFPILLLSSIDLHWSVRKAFLPLLAILWNSAFKWVYLSFSPLSFASLLFTTICKASSDSNFAFLHFFPHGGGLDPCLLYNVMNLHP